MNFCSDCGGKIITMIPEDDNRMRHVCGDCGMIHYLNPKIICGCIPVWKEQILLCKRAIEPRYGYWTLPAGFMENGETTEEAAKRETWEEATTSVRLNKLYCIFSLPHVNQVYLMYLAELEQLKFEPGIESLETKLFTEAEIPWGDLAFSTVKYTLEFYFKERTEKVFSTHVGDILKQDEEYFFRSNKSEKIA